MHLQYKSSLGNFGAPRIVARVFQRFEATLFTSETRFGSPYVRRLHRTELFGVGLETLLCALGSHGAVFLTGDGVHETEDGVSNVEEGVLAIGDRVYQRGNGVQSTGGEISSADRELRGAVSRRAVLVVLASTRFTICEKRRGVLIECKASQRNNSTCMRHQTGSPFENSGVDRSKNQTVSNLGQICHDLL